MDSRQVRCLHLNTGKRQNTNAELDHIVNNQVFNKNVAFIQEPEWHKSTDKLPNLIAANVIRHVNKKEIRRPRAIIYHASDDQITFTKNSTLTDPDCAVALMEYQERNGKKTKALVASIYCDQTQNVDVDIEKMKKNRCSWEEMSL